MMAFSTPCSLKPARYRYNWLVWVLSATICLLLCQFPVAAQEAHNSGLHNTRFDLTDDGVRMSGDMRLTLSESVQDILGKGIPIYFVFETTTVRNRWYWINTTMYRNRRYIRLMYLPLTRKWRVNSGNTPFGRSNTGAILNQHYDSLQAALRVIQRISSWQVLDRADWSDTADFQVQARFRLDVQQLQRPLQIGIGGTSDWNMDWQHTYRLTPAALAQ